MVHIIAMEVLPEERDRKYYADSYSCCPPPLFILLVTIIEVRDSSLIFQPENEKKMEKNERKTKLLNNNGNISSIVKSVHCFNYATVLIASVFI